MLRIMATAIALTAFATTTFVTTAMAQAVCSERARFLEQLAGNFKENTVALGLVNNGSVLEILTSEKGSWTILVTKPDGMSCVVATGSSWEDVPKTLVKSPSA
ncbi:MAG: hypothetical protein HOE62_00790 [Alphaproteobacteria bacterium]|jgi:hypothetical protein|nr:hypothetical protein [Alphaproteobacteria bacterium]MBT4016455.1 hypothetical protein [Alphaproteobacteria bacterium]MBT4966005.1 hypothetical protein [Alphaproteobacteria bacterium]MBT5160867.1 hypothetical protein [Alphaproteobacteria bacterium]